MTFDTRGRQTGWGGGGGSTGNDNSNVGTTTQTVTQILLVEQQPPPSAVNSDATAQSGESTNNAVVVDNISPEKLILSFPTLKLRSLTQKISNPRWVVPVLPEQELEGVDHDCEPCVEFYRNALTTSFSKILTDEAVNSWKYNIHHCILLSCGKLLHLIAIHMPRDNPYLLDLLAMVFDPEITKKSTWLAIDLINRFGQLGGFDNLLERFNCGLQLLKKTQEQSGIEATGSGIELSSKTSKSMQASEDSQDNKLTLALFSVYYALSAVL
ncbi:unnamed protein product [Ceratitis capitata]|uniref:(Mediterranean fruit fly) hypothetical protein n=1 Tax=Ceratitis capitata TaxID=7213 RepID=A0A811UC42_CERCA|nr:unnamed protein product [Ceratitis capitata]